MTTDEAYDMTMAVVKELQSEGIRVEMKPSKSRDNPETVAKYSGPERVKPDKWFHVSFYPENDFQRKSISREVKHLGWLGIFFDNGGGMGVTDWELDWSFKYTGQPDGEIEDRRDMVDHMVEMMIHDKI